MIGIQRASSLAQRVARSAGGVENARYSRNFAETTGSSIDTDIVMA